MKRISLYILVMASLMISNACQNIPAIKGIVGGEKTPAYHEIDPNTLPEVSRNAIDAVDMARLGILESSPYVTALPGTIKLDNTTDYFKFGRCNTIIKEFISEPDGTYVQNMLSESVDHFGRIDVSHERIVFSKREPTESEIADIVESILLMFADIQYMDAESQAQFKATLVEFQRTHGLAADGAMGMNTAQVMARESSVLDVKEMTSRIVLPEKPRNVVYAVPCEVVRENPAAFSKGFESMEAVKKHAITQEKFQKIDQSGQQFTVFVYFLDRVDPGKDVRLALASSEHRWSEVITPIMYALEEWPVLVESFRIDEKLGDARLYANVFQKARFAYTCIGSHQLK